MLQKITDTFGNDSEINEEDPVEYQKPHYAKPLGPNDMNESQLKRLQLNENDRAIMNRVKAQGENSIQLSTF